MSASIFFIQSIDELLDIKDRWQALADNAGTKNLFYEPMLFIPAYRNLATDIKLDIVAVEDDETNDLIGFFPLKVESHYRRIPIEHYSLWRHTHSVTATPLIAQGCEASCLEVFFNWLTSKSCGFPLINFHYFTGSAELQQLILSKAAEYHCKIDKVDQWSRALLSTSLDSQSYYSHFFSRKRVKEHNRLWRRLAEQGNLECYTGSLELAQVESWLAQFLNLEDSGWKSANGTSISKKPSELQFFTEAVTNAAESDRLSVSWLKLDGKMIASECSFTGANGSIMLKIAYDEAYAKFSPGVLLVLKKTEALLVESHAEKEVWFDSCAIADHPMINHLWKQSLTVSNFSTSNGSGYSAFLFTIIGLLVRFKRLLSRGLPWL